VFAERVHIALRRQQELRTEKNPHQSRALYVPRAAHRRAAAAKQLQGKELRTTI